MFCDCKLCAAMPETPAWMRSPEALLAMAERVVAAVPGEAKSWKMHGAAYVGIGDNSTASKSYMKAAKLEGDDERKQIALKNARRCIARLRG